MVQKIGMTDALQSIHSPVMEMEQHISLRTSGKFSSFLFFLGFPASFLSDIHLFNIECGRLPSGEVGLYSIYTNRKSTVGQQDISGSQGTGGRIVFPIFASLNKDDRILYPQQYHDLIKAKYPGYHNTAVSQIIGAKWKSETSSVRRPCHEMAHGIKEEHAKLFPGSR
ncbi:MAG: hypothetical protein GOMPHAMPRED_000030 [Gomphillus americanus]|uniref:HMG box domain-containing protein n=1 Tax=Gomphillus americanus TaxID=1940652 RepID=A0A8H3EFB3_9LECA|nr:MAG: hypothetical protein GOMPHAMPRED_000030 [Gomphillus americanus]